MIYRLYSSDANNLVGKPETGMGYQIVEAAQFRQISPKRYVVYNSELAVDLDSDFYTNKRRLLTEGFTKVLNSSKELLLETNTIKVFSRSAIIQGEAVRFSESRSQKKRHTGSKGAKDNPKENADGKEVFVRLSAYENDRRIDFELKKLKPGSYTTTEIDYNECVSTNDDPIDRYALPNDDKITWAFYIKPKTNDSLQRGIVQPAFGHEGGGIEAYFENGTSNDTYYQKKPYGQ